LAVISGACVLAIAALISSDVIIRAFTSSVPLHSYEISGYLFSVSIALGLPISISHSTHIRVVLFTPFLPPRANKAMDLLAHLTLFITLGVLSYYIIDKSISTFLLHSTSNTTLSIPLLYPQLLWAAGFSISLLYSARNTIRHGLEFVSLYR
jgi:TRAP-type C4-dicarboxylate transport system permease small subunit